MNHGDNTTNVNLNGSEWQVAVFRCLVMVVIMYLEKEYLYSQHESNLERICDFSGYIVSEMKKKDSGLKTAIKRDFGRFRQRGSSLCMRVFL